MQRTTFLVGPGLPPKKGQFCEGISPAYYKVYGVSGVRSVFSTLFSSWQQRYGLSLQQLVYIGMIRGATARELG